MSLVLDEWYGKIIALVGGMAGLYVIQGTIAFLMKRVEEKRKEVFYAAVLKRLDRIEEALRRKP